MTGFLPARIPVRPVVAAAALMALAAGCGGGGGGGRTVPTTMGGADVAPDRDAIVASLAFEDRYFGAGDCSLVEGSVGAEGARRLLTFDTVIVNHGDTDVVLGSPADPVPPLSASDFEWSPCHGHYHFTGWADYRLEDSLGQTVAVGHKQAFCLVDSLPYGVRPSRFATCSYQGISAGWADVYDASLPGQWVDVTDVPEGDYELVVTVNADGRVTEVDEQPNTVRVPVHVPDPSGPP